MMSRFLSPLFALALSLTLAGCSQQQADQTAESAGNAAETTADATGNAAEGVGNAAEFGGYAAGNAAEDAGTASQNAAERIGNTAEDTASTASNMGVTAKVKNALLLSPITQGLVNDIGVDTTDTQVILKGHVHTQQESQEAEKLARSVSGNRTVVNQIEVMKH